MDIQPSEVLAVAPMAGQGTRLGHTGSKEIVRLDALEDVDARAGTRLCDLMLERMAEAGLREAVLTLAEHKQDIREHLGDFYRSVNDVELRLHYAYISNSPNTPTSIDAAWPMMRGRVCALGFADILYQPCAGYRRALAMLARHQADIVLGLFPTSQPTTSDMVAFDAEGRVRDILIKQPRGALYAYTWSLAVWQPSFTEFMHDWLGASLAPAKPATVETFFGDVVQAAAVAGLSVAAVVVSSQPSLDAGTPQSLKLARTKDWLKN